MKENTQEAMNDKVSLQELIREKEQQIGQIHIDLDRLKKKVKAAIYTHQQGMLKTKDLSEEALDLIVDAGDALQYVQTALEKITPPSIDQIKDYALHNCDERIKEAANYKAGQTELEKLLQAKLDRGENLNEHLVGSYAMRRAAKTVLKRNKK